MSFLSRSFPPIQILTAFLSLSKKIGQLSGKGKTAFLSLLTCMLINFEKNECFVFFCNPYEKFIVIVFQSPQMPEVSSTDHLAKFYIGDHVVSSSSLADEYTNSELSSSFLDKSSVRPKRYEEYEFCSKVWIHHPLYFTCNLQHSNRMLKASFEI